MMADLGRSLLAVTTFLKRDSSMGIFGVTTDDI